jgi:hypothetical protein
VITALSSGFLKNLDATLQIIACANAVFGILKELATSVHQGRQPTYSRMVSRVVQVARLANHEPVWLRPNDCGDQASTENRMLFDPQNGPPALTGGPKCTCGRA